MGPTIRRAALLVAICCAAGAAGPPVDFESQVAPILRVHCFRCHGAIEQESGLRLDRRDEALAGGDRGPAFVAGSAVESLLIKLVTGVNDLDRVMPPDAPPLAADEIARLRDWIDAGAVWPIDTDIELPQGRHSLHWSFLPIAQTPIPDAAGDWAKNPIDAFMLAQLTSAGIAPSPEADRETLIRRLSLDLVGLPPTPDEVDRFLADERSTAYHDLVERLLASPRYGERWGRHWLDAARYADSTGFETDAPRSIWKYRDWVIDALNADRPFDEFVVRQLAGDQLPDATDAERIATGFLLCGQQDGGSEPARLDAVVDRVNTIGAVFLGLTVGCAQCHSHKFDPISQREYYGLFAFFNAADEMVLELAAPEEVARRDALKSQLAALVAEREAYAAKLDASAATDDPGYQERSRTIAQIESQVPNLDSTPVLAMPAAVRMTTTFERGDHSRPGPVVEPDVPSVLPPLGGEPTRLTFARWLVSPSQPLTPRVTVNRVWQHFFGRGIVETEDDFGTRGSPPTHPELLDWLAAEFVAGGWRLKSLHRLIVGSATYRQASHRRPDLDAADPENRLLARQSRPRLEAEAIRDSALSAAGLLSPKLGGPSVFPFQHEGVLLNRATPAEWIESVGEDRYRRGLYTHYWRLTPHPYLQTFDAPDAIASCTRRRPSNTPLQALTLLNDPSFVEAAEALARRVLVERQSDEARLDRAFRLGLGRSPNADERAALAELLTEARSRYASSPDRARRALRFGSVTTGDPVEVASWMQVARAILNLDEFVVRE